MSTHVVTIRNGTIVNIVTFSPNSSGYVSSVAIETEFMSQLKKHIPNWHALSDEAIRDFTEKGYAPTGPNSSIQIFRTPQPWYV